MRNKVRPAGRAVLTVLVLAGFLGSIGGLALPQPVSGLQSVSAGDLIPRAWIPFVMVPEVPDVAIYDEDGILRDWDWLVSVFGAVTLDQGTGAAKVVELREAGQYATLIVHVEDSQGAPIVGQEVVFWYSTAPELQPYQQACGLINGVIGYTKDNGNAEFGMSSGSYYFPSETVAGPHVVWIVREGTDCLRGLGMLGGTDHYHLDSVWVLP